MPTFLSKRLAKGRMADMADDLSDCPSGSSTGDEAQRANRLEADLLGLVDVRDQAEFSRITQEGEHAAENLNRRSANKMGGQGPVMSFGSGQGSGGSAGSRLEIGALGAAASLCPTVPMVLTARGPNARPPEESPIFESPCHSSSCACGETSTDELEHAALANEANEASETPVGQGEGPWVRVTAESHVLDSFRVALMRTDPEAKVYTAVRVERNSSIVHLPTCRLLPGYHPDRREPTYTHLLCHLCSTEVQSDGDRLVCAPQHILHSSLQCTGLTETVDSAVLKYCTVCWFDRPTDPLDVRRVCFGSRHRPRHSPRRLCDGLEVRLEEKPGREAKLRPLE